MKYSAGILSAVLIVAGCRGGSDTEPEQESRAQRLDARGRVVLTKREREALDLATASVEEGILTTTRLRFGKVVARPDEDALLVAPVTARLAAPVVSLGASVEAGKALLILEPLVDTASRASLQAQRREIQGQVEGARAQVDAKKSDLERVSTLLSSGLATQADRAQAEATLRTEQARVESLRRAGTEIGRVTGGRLTLTAPASGVIATLATETGSIVQQGAILARIVRAGPRWIDIAVPPGDPVGSGYRAQGVSGQISARLLTQGAVVQADGTRRDRLEAAPDAASNLPPGATVPVEILDETRGIIVPVDAVVRRGRDALVFVEVEAGRYESRPVQIAARSEKRVVVSSGLSRGERIVTRGASSLLGELGATGVERRPGKAP